MDDPTTTRDLVVRARRGGAAGGDPAEGLAAFGELVTRFQDMAYGYAYSILGDFHLAEDAAQEAFVEAYRCLAKLRDPDAFAGWLRRIVQTACGRLTRGKQIVTVPLAGAAGVALTGDGPARTAEKIEMREEVLEAVRRLPAPQREVTTLFYINGYSQNDIADFLEVPVTTVKNRLHASRKRLKQRMLKMVEQTLHEEAPDERFSTKVIEQLLGRPRLLEIEGHPVREAFEAIRAALPDYEVIEGNEVVDGAFWVGPAREGLYHVGEGKVLRSETTVTTFRALAGRTPPVRLLTAGRVFRPSSEDATHQKVFHQLEVLCVEPGADPEAMKATLQRALEAALGPAELQWRQPDHPYPCVERSLDACLEVESEWVELAGCGMLKADTLREGGLDPQAVSGFAFGLGLERLAMLARGIDDIRALWRPPYVPG